MADVASIALPPPALTIRVATHRGWVWRVRWLFLPLLSFACWAGGVDRATVSIALRTPED